MVTPDLSQVYGGRRIKKKCEGDRWDEAKPDSTPPLSSREAKQKNIRAPERADRV